MASTFQEFHGISLAPNSFVENFVVEQLASDPVPVGPGRVWFNTTLKVFRQSTLDSGGSVVVRTFATAEDLAAATGDLTTLTTTTKSNLVAAINELDTGLDAVNLRVDALGNAFNYVGTVAGGADTAGAFDLSTLPVGGKDSGDYYKVTTAGYFKVGAAGTPFYANTNDGLVWNSVGGVDKIDNTDSAVSGTANEITVTGSTDTGYVVSIDTVFSGRVTTLETEATAAQTAAGLNPDGTLTAFSGTTYLDTKSSLRAAAIALDTAVKAEVDRAKAAEGVVSTLTTTATNLTAAINEHDAEIGDLATLSTDAKTSLVAAINEIESLVGGGIAEFKQAINDARYTVTTSTAATSHTITHGLGSTLVDVCVWIDRGDGVWRNDMAGVSIVDANTVQVDLTAARNIRITVEKMEDFV